MMNLYYDVCSTLYLCMHHKTLVVVYIPLALVDFNEHACAIACIWCTNFVNFHNLTYSATYHVFISERNTG